jgi:flagellar hook-length control protein FliK
VLQRAGGIEVTVRTPDPDLAQSLRQHLPELSDRLSQSGIHGAIWQPASGQGPSGDTNSQSDSGSAGQWQREQSDGQRRQPQQEQPNSQQDQERPEASWLNAFITADKETAS